MATAFRNVHEVLGPYLSTASPPTAVSAPSGTQIRLLVGPAGAIPGGLRPIPTTTQSNKKTNAQIPYMRRATEAQGVGGVWEPSASEGSIAFVERQLLVPRHQTNGRGPNQFVDVYSVEQINAQLTPPRAAPFTYDDFPYRLDGVVNNVDGADKGHEFRDYTIINMAVQGPCRLDHREPYRADERMARTSASIYVGLFATRDVAAGPWTHKLERFSSNMITRGKIDLGDDDEATSVRKLLFAWLVGRIVDPAQSETMLAIHVDVRPLRPVLQTDAQLYQPPNPDDPRKRASYVLRWRQETSSATSRFVTLPDVFGDVVRDRSVREQLLGSWGDPAQFATGAETAFAEDLSEFIFSARPGEAGVDAERAVGVGV